MIKRSERVLELRIGSKKLPAWLNTAARDVGEWVFGFTWLNAGYVTLPDDLGDDFSREILRRMNVQIDAQSGWEERLPADGPVVIMANHPHGIIDGLILDAALVKNRADTHILGYYILAEFPELRPRIFPLYPGARKSRRPLNSRGWRAALKHLESDGSLLVFPAGAVARFDWRRLRVRDMPWSRHVARVIRRSGASVLPVHIHGRNSMAFCFAVSLIPGLQSVLMFREFRRMFDRRIQIDVGDLIAPQTIAASRTDAELTAFLRASVEDLTRD